MRCISHLSDHLPTSLARNMALGEAIGEFVQNLDSDDLLPPRALTEACAALVAQPDAAFVFANVTKFWSDGTTETVRPGLPVGVIEPGQISDYWLEHRDLPLIDSSVMWRKDVVVAYGGWPAVHVYTGSALLVPIASRHRSVHADIDQYLYRRHAAQTAQSPFYSEERQRTARFIEQRLITMPQVTTEPPVSGVSQPQGFDDGRQLLGDVA